MTHSIQSWEKILLKPEPGQHAVQAYQDDRFLAEAVGLFIGAGLRNQDAVLVFATDSQWTIFERALHDAGFDPSAAQRSGQLSVLESQDVLSRFMVDELPQWDPFQQTVHKVVSKFRASGGKAKIRKYSGMVDFLWKSGNSKATLRLEEFWNKYSELEDFSLFCSYHVDPLDHEINAGPLQDICKGHSHFIPTRDYLQFDMAFNRASREILGSEMLSGMLRVLSGAHRDHKTEMPYAQAALFWLETNMPSTAKKIRTRMQELRPAH